MRKILFLLALLLILPGCENSRPAPEDGKIPVLTVGSPLPDRILEPLKREFQQRTGIWLETRQGSAQDLTGTFSDDPGSMDLLLGFDPADLEPLRADLADSPVSAVLPGDDPKWSCVFGDVPVILYNPHLIRQNFPTGFADLTSGRWQGSIAFADPARDAANRTVLSLIFSQSGQNREAMVQFGRNLLAPAASAEEVLDRVSEGTAAIGIAPESAVCSARENGAALVQVDPEEGIFLLPLVAAVSADAEEPEAARQFLAFLLEPDTQLHLEQTLHLHPRPDSAGGAWTPLSPQEHRSMLALWTQIREVTP